MLHAGASAPRERQLLAPLFPAVSDPGNGAAHRGAAHPESRRKPYVLAALFKGGELAYLVTEERLTEKVRAAWALGMPPSTEETILRLRSSE